MPLATADAIKYNFFSDDHRSKCKEIVNYLLEEVKDIDELQRHKITEMLAFIEHVDLLEGIDLDKIQEDDESKAAPGEFDTKELRHMNTKLGRLTQARFNNLYIEWLFTAKIHNSKGVCTRFSRLTKKTINNENLRYLLDMLIQHDSAEGFDEVYEYFADKMYCNWYLYERDVFTDYMSNLYLSYAKSSLEELSKVSVRRSAPSSGISIKYMIIYFCTLAENFYLANISSRIYELILERFEEMKANSEDDDIDLKDRITMAVAAVNLHDTSDTKSYQSVVADVFNRALNSAGKSLLPKDVITCFEYYVRVYSFFTKEQKQLTLKELENLVFKTIEASNSDFTKQLHKLITSPEKTLSTNPAIVLFLPLMQEIYTSVTTQPEEQQQEDELQPSTKVRIIVEAMAGANEKTVNELIEKYLNDNKGKYSQSDIYNLHAVLYQMNKEAANCLINAYQQLHKDIYELDYLVNIGVTDSEP